MKFHEKLIPDNEFQFQSIRLSTQSLLNLFTTVGFSREFSKTQKACIAVKSYYEFPAYTQCIIENRKSKSVRLRREILASLVNVSSRLIQKALKVYKEDKNTFDQCWKGKRALNKLEKKFNIVDVEAQGTVLHFTEKSTKELPFYELRIETKNLTCDPDRFQFKLKVDDNGVVNKLKGVYRELGTGRLLIWQDSQAVKYVVDGHHRFAHAVEKQYSSLPCQLLKFSDGVTENDAMSIGAHSNILSGHGSITDYVKYFRENSYLTIENCKRLGLLGRDGRGAKAFLIAKNASEWLYRKLIEEKLSDLQAFSIAEATTEEKWQEKCYQYIIHFNIDHRVVKNYLGKLQEYYRQEGIKSQIDMFGNDPTEMTIDILYFKAVEAVTRKIKKSQRSTQSLISNSDFNENNFELKYDMNRVKNVKRNFSEKVSEINSGVYDENTKNQILEEMIKQNSLQPVQDQLNGLDMENIVGI